MRLDSVQGTPDVSSLARPPEIAVSTGEEDSFDWLPSRMAGFIAPDRASQGGDSVCVGRLELAYECGRSE